MLPWCLFLTPKLWWSQTACPSQLLGRFTPLADQTSFGTLAILFIGINKVINVRFEVLRNVWVEYTQMLSSSDQ